MWFGSASCAFLFSTTWKHETCCSSHPWGRCCSSLSGFQNEKKLGAKLSRQTHRIDPHSVSGPLVMWTRNTCLCYKALRVGDCLLLHQSWLIQSPYCRDYCACFLEEVACKLRVEKLLLDWEMGKVHSRRQKLSERRHGYIHWSAWRRWAKTDSQSTVVGCIGKTAGKSDHRGHWAAF